MKKLMKSAKETVGLGIFSQSGLGIMGGLHSIGGMPSNNVLPITSSSLSLLNTRQLVKNAK